MQFEQAYQADVEITLKVWDDEIDRLVEKREKAEARIGYSCLIAVLHSKRDEIRTDLGRLYKAQVEQRNRQGNNANTSGGKAE